MDKATELRELRAFNQIAQFYSVKDKMIVDIQHLAEIGNSCLTDSSIEVPKADLNNKDIPISYVPFVMPTYYQWQQVGQKL